MHSLKWYRFITLCSLIGILSIQVAFCEEDVLGKSAQRAINLRYRKPSLFVTASFSAPDGYIDAGQAAQIVAVVSNSGSGKAYDVSGYLTGVTPDGLTVQRGAILGTILPGQRKLLCFTLKAVDNLPSSITPLKLIITEKHGHCPMTMSISLSSRGSSGAQPAEKTAITTSDSYDHLIDGIPSPGRLNPHSVAVIIGNRDYDRDGPGLYAFAHKDAAAMNVCVRNIFGCPPENVIRRRNAKRGDYIEIFGSEKKPGLLARSVRPDTTDLVIYYSGRGYTDDKSNRYLLPVDCNYDMKKLHAACYSIELLMENIASLSPRSVTILFDTSFENHSSLSADIGQASFASSQTDNQVIFIAAGNGETANRCHESMHGLFTGSFIRTVSKLAREGAFPITASAVIDRLNDEGNGIPHLAQSIFKGKRQHTVVHGNRELLMIR